MQPLPPLIWGWGLCRGKREERVRGGNRGRRAEGGRRGLEEFYSVLMSGVQLCEAVEAWHKKASVSHDDDAACHIPLNAVRGR